MLPVKFNCRISRTEVTWIRLLVVRFICIGSCVRGFWAFAFDTRVEFLYRAHCDQATSRDMHWALQQCVVHWVQTSDSWLYMAVARFPKIDEPFKVIRLRAPPVQHSTTVRSAHTVFMCFVFIWEQTATCATYSINWFVFIDEKCLQRGKDWVCKYSGLRFGFKGLMQWQTHGCDDRRCARICHVLCFVVCQDLRLMWLINFEFRRWNSAVSPRGRQFTRKLLTQ